MNMRLARTKVKYKVSSCTPFPARATLMRFAATVVIPLVWSSIAFCGEIHDAVENGAMGRVEVLLKDNPELVFSKDSLFGETPLHTAVRNGKAEMAELLLANKAAVNAKDKDGKTPLHQAAYGAKDIVELLLANKADINAKDDYGRTPLHNAAEWGRKDMVELLLANKAEVDAKDNGNSTPLLYAVNNMHQLDEKTLKTVVELLLVSGADVNAKDKYGQTPLLEAVGCDYKEIVELLLANKADVNATDFRGTPLHVALEDFHDDIAQLLRQHGGQDVKTVDGKSTDGSAASGTSSGVPAISFSRGTTGKSKTSLAGQFTLPMDLEVVNSKYFDCTPIHLLKKDDGLATIMSEDESWSVDTQVFKSGEKQVTYPIMGGIKCSDGGFRGMFLATTRIKIGLKAGEVVLSDGYRIEAKRAFNAGESIPSIYFFTPIMALESVPAANADSKNQHPCLIISHNDAKTNVPLVYEEAWRAFKEHVSK